MREYFRYAGASTRTLVDYLNQNLILFGKVAEERVKRLQTQYIN
jgi:hypothetical protein